MERSRRRWCGLVCERVTARVYKWQRRQQSATRLTSSTRLVQCVRMLRARGHTLIIITLGTRETKLVYPRAPHFAGLRRCRPRNNRYYATTIRDTRLGTKKLNQSPKKYRLYGITHILEVYSALILDAIHDAVVDIFYRDEKNPILIPFGYFSFFVMPF